MNRKFALLLIPVSIFGLDGILKHYIDKTKKLGAKEKICGGRLILKKYYNNGAALNFLESRPKILLAVQGALLFAAAVIYGRLFSKDGNTGLLVSLGMLLGGGMSNFYDRVKKKHVVDYVSFSVPWKWLSKIVFNISDFFIFAGALLTVWFKR